MKPDQKMTSPDKSQQSDQKQSDIIDLRSEEDVDLPDSKNSKIENIAKRLFN